MSDARKSALHAQSMGRYGDTILMHVNEKELMGLAGLGKITGHNITINPETGLPEAFSFGKILPWILGAAAIALTAGAATPAVVAAEGAAALGTGVAAAATPAIAAVGTTAAEATALGTAASAVPAAAGGAAGGIGTLGTTAATMTPEAIAAANAAATAPIAYTPLAAPVADAGVIAGSSGTEAMIGSGAVDTLTAAAPVESAFPTQTSFVSEFAGAPDLSAPMANNSVNAAGSGGAYAPEALLNVPPPAAETWGAKGLRWAGDAADWAVEHPTQTAMGLSMVQSLIPGPKQKGEEEYDPKKNPMKFMPSGYTKNARYSSPRPGYNASYEHSFFPGYNAFKGYEEGGPVAGTPVAGEGVQQFLAGLQANAESPADFIAQLASNPKTRTLLPMIEQIMKGTQPQMINRGSSMDTPVEQRRGYAKGGGVSRAEQDAINKAIEDRIAPHNWSNGDAMTQDPARNRIKTGPWWADGSQLPSGKNHTDLMGRIDGDAASYEDLLYFFQSRRDQAQYDQAQNKGALFGFDPEKRSTIGYSWSNPNQIDYYTDMIRQAKDLMKEEGRGPGYADGGQVTAQSGGGYGGGYGYSQSEGQGGRGNPFANIITRGNGGGSKGTSQGGGQPPSPSGPPTPAPEPFSINTDQWVSDFGPGAVNRMGYTPSQTPNWRSQVPTYSSPLTMRQPVPFNAPPLQQTPVFNQPVRNPTVLPPRYYKGKKILGEYGQPMSQREAWRASGYRGSAFAEGGEVMEGINSDEQAGSDQVVAAVIQAIQEGGQSPQSQQAIMAFVQMFGQEALTDLIQRVKGMESQSSFRAPDGSLSGPGDGQSDSIPAMIDGQAPAALSTGEHVIDKLTVDAAGGGDNDAGHAAMNKIKEGLRTQAFGSPELPQPGNVNRILRG